jgi:hypothetical protein
MSLTYWTIQSIDSDVEREDLLETQLLVPEALRITFMHRRGHLVLSS